MKNKVIIIMNFFSQEFYKAQTGPKVWRDQLVSMWNRWDFFRVKATGLFSWRCNMVYFAEASGINEEFWRVLKAMRRVLTQPPQRCSIRIRSVEKIKTFCPYLSFMVRECCLLRVSWIESFFKQVFICKAWEIGRQALACGWSYFSIYNRGSWLGYQCAKINSYEKRDIYLPSR